MSDFWLWGNVVGAIVGAGFVVWSNDRATRATFLTPLILCGWQLLEHYR